MNIIKIKTLYFIINKICLKIIYNFNIYNFNENKEYKKIISKIYSKNLLDFIQ